MTEIRAFIKDNMICFDYAGSMRDMRANELVLLPSWRVLNPRKHTIECLPIDKDVAAVKYYISNRGVPYIEIWDLRAGKIVARFEKKISDFAVRAVLAKLGLNRELIDKVVELYLG